MSTASSAECGVKAWSSEMEAIARRQDRESFMCIYDHFMPRLCLYLRGVGAAEAIAEELAQEALLRLWQNAAGYDAARSAVSTWLFRIARNLHIDHGRRRDNQPASRGELDEGDWCTDPEATGINVDQAALQSRIDALSSIQARLVRMSYFEAKSHGEIAAELGMPLGTVKSHLRRAFLRLQEELGEGS